MAANYTLPRCKGHSAGSTRGRLSAPTVRQQFIECKGYTDKQLPCVQTIGAKLNRLGFRLRTVVKSRPQKK